MVATTATTTPFDAKDVNDQVNKTISQDGLLMRMAKANGEQYAAGRGLSNSSIGAEASQRAIVDAALPIASQNAGQAWKSDENRIDRSHQLTMQGNQFGHEKGMAELQYKNSLGLLDAQGKQELAQLEAQFKNQSALNQQQNTFSAGQSALDRQQQTNLTNLNFKNQSALNTQQNQYTTQRDSTLFGYDQNNKATDFANSLKTMSEQQKNDLAKLNNQNAQQTALAAQQQQYALTNTAKQVAANTQGMYLEAINGLTSTFGDQVAAIQASALKAADKTTAVNSLINSQNAMLKFYQNTYQNMSTIKDDWINVDVITLPTGTIPNIK